MTNRIASVAGILALAAVISGPASAGLIPSTVPGLHGSASPLVGGVGIIDDLRIAVTNVNRNVEALQLPAMLTPTGIPEVDLLEIHSLDTLVPADRVPPVPIAELVSPRSERGRVSTPLSLGNAASP